MVDVNKLDSSDDWHESFTVELFKVNRIRLTKFLTLLIGEYEAKKKRLDNENDLYIILSGNGFFKIKPIYTDPNRSRWNLNLLISALKECDLLHLLDGTTYKSKREIELEKQIEFKDSIIDYYKEGLKDAQEQIESLKSKLRYNFTPRDRFLRLYLILR